MLRIYPHQLEHFAALTRSRFLGLAYEEIADTMAEHVDPLDDEALLDLVDRLLAFCDRVGVDTEPEALALIKLLVALRSVGAVAMDASTIAPWIVRAVDTDHAPAGKVRHLAVTCLELEESGDLVSRAIGPVLSGDPLFDDLVHDHGEHPDVIEVAGEEQP